MLTPEQITAAREEAKQKYLKKLHDKQVEVELEILKAKKGHYFPKKVVFQWPVRLEDWYKPTKCCGSRPGWARDH